MTKVVDHYTICKEDPETGEVVFESGMREIEVDGAVLTEAEAIERDKAQAIVDANDTIKAQLREADIAMLRFLYEGDQARIKAHLASQAELRKKLR